MVEVKDVRDFLTGLAISRVPDQTIAKQIEVANTSVESEKSAVATKEQVEDAKLVLTSYLSLGAYAMQLERSAGGTPPEISRQLDFLRTMAEAMMAYVRRGAPVFLPPIAQPETLDQQYAQGDLVGEVH